MDVLGDMVPEADRALWADELTQNPRLAAAPDQFVRMIVYRIFTEVSRGELKAKAIHVLSPHTADAIRTWVDREVHFAVEGRTMDRQRYAAMREAIVRAIAKRAIELFAAWNSHYEPRDEQDGRNLRDSLRSYVPADMLVAS